MVYCRYNYNKNKRMKKITIFFVILALALVLSGCGSQPVTTVKQAPPDKNSLQVGIGNFDVKIQNFTFDPADINIEKGTTVVWTNEDSAPHIVVSDTDPAQSKLLSPELKTGETYNFVFDTAGKFSYHCQIHPSMKGSITVK